MGVLINGIALPKNGTTELTIYEDGRVLYKQDDGQYIEMGDATAIELPPYGRLIDADELEKAAEKMVICDSYEYTIAHDMVKGLLKMAPTVLEANNGKADN